MFTDSEQLFNVIIRNASATEKRLMIDAKAAREEHNDGIIDDMIWIRRKLYVGDDMKNAAILPEFIEALNNNQLLYEIEQSVKWKNCSQASEKIPSVRQFVVA